MVVTFEDCLSGCSWWISLLLSLALKLACSLWISLVLFKYELVMTMTTAAAPTKAAKMATKLSSEAKEWWQVSLTWIQSSIVLSIVLLFDPFKRLAAGLRCRQSKSRHNWLDEFCWHLDWAVLDVYHDEAFLVFVREFVCFLCDGGDGGKLRLQVDLLNFAAG